MAVGGEGNSEKATQKRLSTKRLLRVGTIWIITDSPIESNSEQRVSRPVVISAKSVVQPSKLIARTAVSVESVEPEQDSR